MTTSSLASSGFSLPMRVWVSRSHASLVAPIGEALGAQASVLQIASDGSQPGEGPAIFLAAPPDLAPGNEPALQRLMEGADPGRLVLYGGEQDRAVLLTAINHWRVFRLIPSVAGLPAVTDALRKAHEATWMELALEQSIRDLTAQNSRLGRTLERLQRTRSQLLHAERLTTLGRLTAGLGQALDAHRSATEDLAEAAAPASLDSEMLDLVGRTLEGGRALDALLSDLIFFAENRERPLRLAAHDADSIAAGAIRIAEMDPAARKRIVRFLPAAPVTLNADRYAIYQVLINLIRNAIEATGDGGQVTLSTRATSDEVTFEVEDNGCGMAPEVCARIFEPFFTTKGRDGLGLGLRVSRHTAERHGGRIEVSSTPERGSAFRLVLPLAR